MKKIEFGVKAHVADVARTLLEAGGQVNVLWVDRNGNVNLVPGTTPAYDQMVSEAIRNCPEPDGKVIMYWPEETADAAT